MKTEKRRTFESTDISDQKRVARGEHLRFARVCLRVRDEQHHRPWKVLMVAGPAPEGEIGAIKELMPKAEIVAVDRDPACVEAALRAGAKVGITCDLAPVPATKQLLRNRWQGPGLPYKEVAEDVEVLAAPGEIVAEAPFDIVHLDVCAVATAATREMFDVYRRLLAPGGVLISTVTYGRDVTEVFMNMLQKYRGDNRVERLLEGGMPDHIAARVLSLFTIAGMRRLRSVIAYRGSSMPVLSILSISGNSGMVAKECKFLSLAPDDFEALVTEEISLSRLYDCPADRILSIRRSLAARKAVETRQRAAG